MILHPTRVSTRRFTYHEGVFTAELSDLGRDFRFGRVYDDACDVGLTLVSHATGREVVFAIENEMRGDEGDVLWIDLAPVLQGIDPRRHYHPNLTVRLYND